MGCVTGGAGASLLHGGAISAPDRGVSPYGGCGTNAGPVLSHLPGVPRAGVFPHAEQTSVPQRTSLPFALAGPLWCPAGTSPPMPRSASDWLAARPPEQPVAVGGGGPQPLHVGAVCDPLAARRVRQSIGSGGAGAPLLHAGAVFDSLEGFKQVLQKEQEHFECEVVLHKKIFNGNTCAYICREAQEAIQAEGVASNREDRCARDWQWRRLVCAGACEFVAEVRQATEEILRTTTLRVVMQAHIHDNPLAAAPCEIGVNGVSQGQWVVTIYSPHKCKAGAAAPAAAASVAAPNSPAAPVVAALAAAAPVAAFGTPATPVCTGTAAAVADAAAVPATAASASDLVEEEAATAQPTTERLLTQQGTQEQDAVRRPLQSTGPSGAGAPSVHAGAVFDSLEAFRQALKRDQERIESKTALHKGIFRKSSGAYICSATHKVSRRRELFQPTRPFKRRGLHWPRMMLARGTGSGGGTFAPGRADLSRRCSRPLARSARPRRCHWSCGSTFRTTCLRLRRVQSASTACGKTSGL
jgi:hypothetical protein